MKTATALRRLIRSCVDDECTLQHETEFVDSTRGRVLTRLALERKEFVEELERLGRVQQHRGHGSWAELLREAGRNVWVKAAGPNNGDAISTCRHSHTRTEARYEEALQRPWPEEILRALAAQHRRLHDETQELVRLQF